MRPNNKQNVPNWTKQLSKLLKKTHLLINYQKVLKITYDYLKVPKQHKNRPKTQQKN